MKLFFDTCTLVDYLCNRQNANHVEAIFDTAEKKKWSCYISVGSFYTLTYLIELHLKHGGLVDKTLRTEKLREMLTSILDTFSIADIFANNLSEAVADPKFTDLEDSYQFRAAINAKCDYLITVNIHDFKDADTTEIKILTPSDFLTEI